MRIRLEYVDCLRGLAIAGVVLVHSGQLVRGLPGWLQSFTEYGGKGVELFFVFERADAG
jgi:peptidoglycan/LPS O-acetylase OafA/YrhL